MQMTDTPYITNREVARILFQTAALLEMMECNPYRIQAYRRTALRVLFLSRQLADYVLADAEIPVTGMGAGMRQKLKELVNTGRMDSHEVLVEEFGEPLASLLLVEGIGPKTAVRLVSELQVGSLRDLEHAASEGKIQTLRGFGKKREALIGEAVRSHLVRAA